MTQALVLTPQSIFMIPTVRTCKLKTQLNGHFYKISACSQAVPQRQHHLFGISQNSFI